jgi:hypothetical protein
LIFGAWAAIGPEAFGIRVAAYTLSGPLLILVGMLGLYLTAPRTFFPGLLSFPKTCVVVALISIPICVATQVPYWAFRTLLGWEFVLEQSDWEEKKFSLQEMFLLTAVFAIAFAAPRFATEVISDAIASDVQIEAADSGGMGVSIGVIVYSAVIALLSLLFTPAVWFCLRKGSTVKGVYVAVLFLFVLLSGSGCLGAVLAFGWQLPSWVIISYLFVFPAVFAVGGVLPLLASRRRGIRLVTRDDCREKSAQQS